MIRKQLINKIVSDNYLMDGVISLAESTIDNPPIAIKSIKELMYSHILILGSDMIPKELLVVTSVIETKGRKEAVRSFLEKRSPGY